VRSGSTRPRAQACVSPSQHQHLRKSGWSTIATGPAEPETARLCIRSRGEMRGCGRPRSATGDALDLPPGSGRRFILMNMYSRPRLALDQDLGTRSLAT